MSERNLTDADIKAIGDAVASSLISALSKEETAIQIMGQWEKWMDLKIGKGVRKFAFTVIMMLLSIAALKFNWWDKIFK